LYFTTGEAFLRTATSALPAITTNAGAFVRDDKVILVHGFSRVVIGVLLKAAQQGRRFRVVVTEARPDGAGYRAAAALCAVGVPVELVLDAAVGAVMERVGAYIENRLIVSPIVYH
jgi:translation initiation factor eIF-2B subunit alpha